MTRRTREGSFSRFVDVMRSPSVCGVALAAAAVIACRKVEPTVATTILRPANGGEAFEPSVAIDPTDSNHLIVAAMYGVPFGRGGKGIWVWQSTDGGHTWTDGPLEPPRLPNANITPTAAADVITGFDLDGTPLLTSKSDAPPLGGTFVSRYSAAPPNTTESTLIYRNAIDSSTGRRVLYDKPWMIVDHDERSPFHGSIYVSTGAITTGLGEARIGINWTILGAQQLLAFSRNGGRTFSTPTAVGDSSAFAGYTALGSLGAVEIAYMRLRNKDGAGDAILHRRSVDGGVSFEPAVTVATTTGDTLLEGPALAARPNGDLLACWSQGDRSKEQTNAVRCATRKSGAAWAPPRGLEPVLPPNVVAAWPTVVGTERGWYLMLYLVGVARTEVVLFSSQDGTTFTRFATLSTVDGLGIDRVCVTLATACRRTRSDAFVIGDYLGLAAGGGRLAAAYVLPRTQGQKDGFASVYLTTVIPP